MGIILQDLEINPERFFRLALGERRTAQVPGLIILLGAVAAAISGYFAGNLSASMMEPVLQGIKLAAEDPSRVYFPRMPSCSPSQFIAASNRSAAKLR